MENSWNGKVALVTGGTKGIGKAIADKLTILGATVVVTARSKPDQLAAGQHFIAADHFKAEAAELIANEILERYGKIDVIVNNAGANLSPGGGYSTLNDEHWERDWQLNFMSAVRMNKALLPTMLEQGQGNIIHISTGAAKQPIWDMTMSYSSAKAALNAYSKALANELGSKGIRVNTVSPGVVKTPLMMDFIAHLAQSANRSYEATFDSVVEQVGVPLARMAEPEEIAELVVFLASDDARYITGCNYAVDGGASPTV